MRYAITAALALLPVGAVMAQQAGPMSYQTVACIKVEPGKFADFQEFTKKAAVPTMQAMADSGPMSGWYLFRSVLPAGADTRCDYVSVSSYKTAPPAPRGIDAMREILQKAGIGMSAEDYFAKRSSVSRLVSNEMWTTVLQVGAIQKGDYLYANSMKVHNMKQYMDFERDVWKPMAEYLVEKGNMRGWTVIRAMLPAGTDVKYAAMSMDVFPSWDAAMKPLPVQEAFAKVHAGKDINEIGEQLGKLRDMARRDLMVLDEMVKPASRSITGVSDREQRK